MRVQYCIYVNQSHSVRILECHCCRFLERTTARISESELINSVRLDCRRFQDSCMHAVFTRVDRITEWAQGTTTNSQSSMMRSSISHSNGRGVASSDGASFSRTFPAVLQLCQSSSPEARLSLFISASCLLCFYLSLSCRRRSSCFSCPCFAFTSSVLFLWTDGAANRVDVGPVDESSPAGATEPAQPELNAASARDTPVEVNRALQDVGAASNMTFHADSALKNHGKNEHVKRKLMSELEESREAAVEPVGRFGQIIEYCRSAKTYLRSKTMFLEAEKGCYRALGFLQRQFDVFRPRPGTVGVSFHFSTKA
jgi:hypothetical protein